MFSVSPALYGRPQANVNTMSISLLHNYSLVMSTTNEILHFRQYRRNIPPMRIVRGFLAKGGRFPWICWISWFSGLVANQDAPGVLWEKFQKPLHHKNSVKAESLFYLLWVENRWRAPPWRRRCYHRPRKRDSGPLLRQSSGCCRSRRALRSTKQTLGLEGWN